MKTYALTLAGAVVLSSMIACSSNSNDNANADSAATTDEMNVSQASYVNPNTGEPVSIVMDSEKGYYVYSDSKEPIEKDMIFVDVNTRDTLYGAKGVVINTAVKNDGGTYTLDETKVERDGDEIKIKTADGKLKIDGDELKYKEGEEDKIKVDGDDAKTKTATSKTKTDDGETKTKVQD